MLSIKQKIHACIYIAAICTSFNVLALNTLKVLRPQSAIVSHHSHFKDALLKRAMEVTSEEYGAYKFVVNTIRMNRSRALMNIIKGESHNVYIAPGNQEWAQQAIEIKIPVRLGLLSYRLLLIHKDDLELFSHINTLEQLKALKAGLRTKWLTTKIFKNNKFTMIENENYNRLFLLLDKHKFDYFPRSIYEIYDELADRDKLYKNIVVEPTIALHLPTATYVYVSPNEPELAKRIMKGLTQLFESGELRTIVEKYYGDNIKKAQLATRKIIDIDNPFYLESDRLNDQKYLYNP